MTTPIPIVDLSKIIPTPASTAKSVNAKAAPARNMRAFKNNTASLNNCFFVFPSEVA